jgi:hypothetical protein
MSRKQMGSNIDDFLEEEGIFEEAQAQAIKEVVVWQRERNTNQSTGSQAQKSGRAAAGSLSATPESNE